MNDFERIASVIEYINRHRREQPSLEELAECVDLSPHHFQRLFSRWAGISPKKFLQCLTAKAVKEHLQNGKSVLESAYAEGLSGPGRLHDLSVLLEAASPGEIKSGGAGWTIFAGIADSPFGNCLIAESPRGICKLAFLDEQPPATKTPAAEHEIAMDWPQAEIVWDHQRAKSVATGIFSHAARKVGDRPTLSCLVQGTAFQVKVWQALLQIPTGQFTTYGKVAAAIGNPKASRAVGSAIGKNDIGYLIPCHRVIRETGVVGEYRWGSLRKQALIAREMALGSK